MARFAVAVLHFLRVVFGREELPQGLPPAPEQPGRSVLRLLFAPEPLPMDPPPAPRRRGRLFAWLFAPERLDDEGDR